MPEFPSGTVTFLFTDVEGSTRRWEADSPAMLAAVERHFAIIDAAVQAHYGVRFKVIGDAIQAAFPTALDGVLAAIEAQRALIAEDWGALGPIQVRMALHTGTATPHDGDYLAPSLNRLARLLSAGFGGQLLVTEVTRNLVRDTLPAEVTLRDLGEHRLRDLREAEHVYQVTAPGLPADFPPLMSLSRQMHNLPAQVTGFVGREQEVEQIQQRLAEPGVRLLTLTGPGGTGKTRLSLEAAGTLIEGYPDGVWVVPLGPVSSSQLVASAIAAMLGVREAAGEPIDTTLGAFLAQKRLLLILDNFEHLLAAAPLVAELLAHCPSIQVLATSRAPLRIAGEHEMPISPLEVPEIDGGLEPQEALASPAVRLFVERARAVRGDFALTEHNVTTIVGICRRLDGLPLAIELAAARIRLLPPDAILSRLDNRLSLLTGGGRERPERQQTLRAAIAWSHDLLDPETQALFRRLSVFADGWTIEAADAVAGVGAPVSALDGLATLNDNSLIQQQESQTQESGGDIRFAMLQTIQEFSRDQLQASDEREQVQAAHAAFFLDFAATAEPKLVGREAAIWLGRLDADHENLRAALAWLRQQPDPARAVDLAGSLWRFWWLRGHISEGRSQLEETLSRAGASDVTASRARALDGAGVLAETQGDDDRAETLHRQALAISRNLDDRKGIARSLENLGVVAFDRGEHERATALLDESLALAREAGNQELIATALNDLGRIAYERGELQRAEGLYQESLDLRRQAASGSEIARSLNNLGIIAFDLGDFGRARRLFDEGLGLYREAGDRWGAAGSLYGLAGAVQQDNDLPRAVALLDESLSLFRETGDARNASVVLLSLAAAHLEQGDLETARAGFRDALSGFTSDGDRAGIIDAISGLARTAIGAGEIENGTRLFGAVENLAELDRLAISISPPIQVRDDLSAAKAALGEPAFSTFWEEGRGLSLEDAQRLALGGGFEERRAREDNPG
jgi:predicted ATPase/class 3 adenylate cyclase